MTLLFLYIPIFAHTMCVNYFRILLMNLSFRRFPIFFQGYTLYLRLWACRAEAGPSRAKPGPSSACWEGRCGQGPTKHGPGLPRGKTGSGRAKKVGPWRPLIEIHLSQNPKLDSAADCSIWVKFVRKFDHLSARTLHTFKVNGSKVNVTAWHNKSRVKMIWVIRIG